MITIKSLQVAAKELNKMLGLEPAINVKGSETELKSQLSEAFEMLEPDEIGALSPISKALYDQMQNSDDSDDDNSDDANSDDDNSDDFSKMSLQELKDSIKTDERLAGLRKGLGLQKDVAKLLLRVKDAISGTDSQNDQKEQKTGKKVDGEKGDIFKGPGIIKTIIELVENAPKQGISRDQVWEALKVKFPERDADKMKKTVVIQLPSRIQKEKFPITEVTKGFYRKTK